MIICDTYFEYTIYLLLINDIVRVLFQVEYIHIYILVGCAGVEGRSIYIQPEIKLEQFSAIDFLLDFCILIFSSKNS